MKKQILIFVVALASFFSSYAAQDVVARVHNGATVFHYINPNYTHTTLQDIIDASSDGDTLYLPGVSFSCSGTDVVLNKRLVIIGTGVLADSATAVGDRTTKFVGSNSEFRISTSSASGAQLHGVNFENMGISIGQNASTQNVSNIKIYRCEMNWLQLGSSGNPNLTTASNFLIENCYIKNDINVCQVPTVTIRGCVINNSIIYGTQFTNCTNNLFVNYTRQSSNSGITFKDNIFLVNITNNVYTINDACQYYNNLFVTGTAGSVAAGTSVFSGSTNLTATNIANVFVAPPTTNPLTTFSYYANYHLKTGTPYLTMSSTGGAVGQYAGNPTAYWKDGLLPFNPHWRELQVPANTNNGLLNIVIKASAQQY